MKDYGDIILVKNIVFNDGLADHASLQGRICLILSDANDVLTLLPFTHNQPKTTNKYIYKLRKEDLQGKNNRFNYYENQYLRINSLFQREIFFYDRVAHLNEEKYYYLLVKIVGANLEKDEYCGKIYTDIKEDLIEQGKYLKKKLKIR